MRIRGMATAVRTATTALLVASGAMSVAAARERWAPACGSWEAPACLRVQDHRYDYLSPSAPWTPIGEAAQYAAVAQVLLAAALLVLPTLIFRGRPVLTLAVGAATSLSVLLVAQHTWDSAQAGVPVLSQVVAPATSVWALLWPLAVMVLALLPRRTPDRAGRGWRICVVLALLMASPIPQAFMSIGPYDAAPWADALGGYLVILAGCALWPATTRRTRRVEPGGTTRHPGSLAATT